MKIAAMALATLGLAVAGSATAFDRLTDVDYLKAERCRGLAEGLGVNDTSGLDALLKSEGRSRLEIVYVAGEEAMAHGKRDASHWDGKERLKAEFDSVCEPYLGGGGGGRQIANHR